jgi:hypothetical protein
MSCGGFYDAEGNYFTEVAEIDIYKNNKLVSEIDIYENFTNTVAKPPQINSDMVKKLVQTYSNKLKNVSLKEAEGMKNNLKQTLQKLVDAVDKITPQQAQMAVQKLGLIVDQIEAMMTNYMVIQSESAKIGQILSDINKDLIPSANQPNAGNVPMPTHAMGYLPNSRPASQVTGSCSKN